jgi:hypothetical protein
MKHEASMHDLTHPPLIVPAGTRMVACMAARDAAGVGLAPAGAGSACRRRGWIGPLPIPMRLDLVVDQIAKPISMRLEGIAPRANHQAGMQDRRD